ncbi:expressed unknown protein [Seminavis robusta]|uniref:Uncharacterized protein n=1 Tax=Seminavis robusta TaxID=568900 RepID=A0A9N8H1Z6_9STRA|nr:expressed unknown protein [Seminavis robusta]|eukprot:Sro2_g001260.1 n/a (298) ;mRNA; f:76748-77730
MKEGTFKKGPLSSAMAPNSDTKKEQRGRDNVMYMGAWTFQEMEYVEKLVVEYRAGNLPELASSSNTTGTMRAFIAEKLQCNPKRISKKFENTEYNGRLQYTHQAVTLLLSPAEAQKNQDELKALEETFWSSRNHMMGLKNLQNRVPSSQPYGPASRTGHVNSATGTGTGTGTGSGSPPGRNRSINVSPATRGLLELHELARTQNWSSEARAFLTNQAIAAIRGEIQSCSTEQLREQWVPLLLSVPSVDSVSLARSVMAQGSASAARPHAAMETQNERPFKRARGPNNTNTNVNVNAP